ncbi:MAG TPA: exonuclease domain-containing protein, partial [Fibrobacteraceae bacterium]|nr:exonuclease domain-containing protein [Fibrobacteraceae bacterium]
MRFAIVDLETTGGQPKNDRIIEIGIVLMDGTEIVQTYESLVYPGRFIPPFVQSLTGIHSEMVESAPPF